MPAISRPTKPLAKVNVYEAQKDGAREIEVCFLPDLLQIFGEDESRAVMGFDASRSMRQMYGAMSGPFQTDSAPNYVQAVARKLGAILSGGTKSGKSAAFYWAMNPAGDGTQMIGEFDAAGWAAARVPGPAKITEWGRDTRLLPALKIVVEQVHRGADFTMGIIITDGIIVEEDEKDCMSYCMGIGKAMHAGKVKPLKLVLIGVGEEVDTDQLDRFDDMFEGTDLEGKVDLWSTGVVASMQDEADIYGVLFGELMDAGQIVAPSGRVESSNGKELASWTDGMPGKFRFNLPKGETKFVIRAGGQVIEQDCSEVLAHP